MQQGEDDTANFVMGDIIFNAVSMNEAALRGDLDESRNRACDIVSTAENEGFTGIARAAKDLLNLLGPSGTEPQGGFGAAMVAISTEIDRAIAEA